MKARVRIVICVLCLLLLGGGCADSSGDAAARETLTITDWTGHSESFATCPQQVIALSASLGEVWMLAGGELCGITEDAVAQGRVTEQEIAVIGSIKEPNLEMILSMNPDFVILSADIAAHLELAETLASMEIAYGLFHEEYLEDYLALLQQFTTLTGCQELYESNGTAVEESIGAIMENSLRAEGKTVLLLRAYSSGCKAKDSENLAGVILKDFGFDNVMDHYESQLEELSMEQIMLIDPDYIFVTTMGTDTEAALAYVREHFQMDPAWQSLTAIENGNYHVLPKDLFHNKPNARWAESYDYIADILAEESTAE